MTYSCALWDTPESTLEDAQIAMLDYHAKQARAVCVDRVLDIGCGWGAMMQRLLSDHNVKRVVGLSLSEQQVAHVHNIASAQMEVRLESWADHTPAEPYGAIISVGAFEHFARPDLDVSAKMQGYRDFFQRCHAWLKPGGCVSLQTMSYENSSRADFSELFKEHIFPESDLPRLSEIAASSDRLFEIVRLRNDREHYARTMIEWRRRLRGRREEAVAAVGAEAFDRYDKYLQMATIGFHIGTMGLLRITLRRIGP